MRDIISEISATMRRNKLRTALTGFAVAWGIFMLIVLLGAGNGLINAQLLHSGKFLSNSMVVYGGETSKAYQGLKEGRSISLDDNDMRSTERSFADNVDEVGAELEQGGVTIANGENYLSGSLTGVYPNEIEINKKEMLCGRFINRIDIDQTRRVLVLSESNAKELLPNDPESLIGRYVNVGGMAFRVVGIYKTDKTSMDNASYTAFTTLRAIYGKGNEVGNIAFSFHGLPDEAANEDFEARYRSRINRNHRADPDDENAIWIWNRFTNNLQMSTGIGIIRTALWVVGLLTLLSGVVGVSNIMLITVKERTHEFGIRKAIGAGPMSILRLIIIESVLITTFFGYVGMLLGIAANEYMDATIGHEVTKFGDFEITMFHDPTVGLSTCIAATAVMVLAGTVAGLVPALKAARTRPIEALRAE